jgi:hypothetical protein
MKLNKCGSLTISLIPPFFLSCVVALGVSINGSPKGNQRTFLASGFFLGERVDTDAPGQYRVFLVTDSHVVDGLRTSIASLEGTSPAPNASPESATAVVRSSQDPDKSPVKRHWT